LLEIALSTTRKAKITAERQYSHEVNVKLSLFLLKMSVVQGKIAIQPFFTFLSQKTYC